MINECFLMGRLTADTEIKMAGQTPTTSFSIAVNRKFKNKDGNYDTDFIDIRAFGKTAEFIHKYFKKGNMIMIFGSLRVDNWKDREGKNRRSVYVVADQVEFCESKSKEEHPAPKEDDFAILPDEVVPDLPF